MKNQFAFANIPLRPSRIASVLAGLLLTAAVASAAPAPAPAEILPPSSLPYGLSYQEWSAKWWQWSLEQATNHLELVGGPGICSGPASRVRFLAGIYVPETGGITAKTNRVAIEPGTPLFFPILSVWVDNSGCPFTTLTVDELAAEAAGEWSAVTVTSCTIDGLAVAGLDDPGNTEYLAQASPFSYTTSAKDNVLKGFFGEPCVGGDTTIYPAVAQGVYLMVAPLKPGKHTMHFTGIVAPGGAVLIQEEITYDITVL